MNADICGQGIKIGLQQSVWRTKKTTHWTKQRLKVPSLLRQRHWIWINMIIFLLIAETDNMEIGSQEIQVFLFHYQQDRHVPRPNSVWLFNSLLEISRINSEKSLSSLLSSSMERVSMPWIYGSSPLSMKQRLKTEWRSALCCWATGLTRHCSIVTAKALWTWRPLLSWRRDLHVSAALHLHKPQLQRTAPLTVSWS